MSHHRRIIAKPVFPNYIENPIQGVCIEDILKTADASVLLALLDQTSHFVVYISELIEDWINSINAKSNRINDLIIENERMKLPSFSGEIDESNHLLYLIRKSIYERGVKVGQYGSGPQSIFDSETMTGSGQNLSSPNNEHKLYPANLEPKFALFTKASEHTCTIRNLEYECSPPPNLGLLDTYREDGIPCMKFYSYPDFFFDEWKKLMLLQKSSGSTGAAGKPKKKKKGAEEKSHEGNKGTSKVPKDLVIKKYNKEGQLSVTQLQSSRKIGGNVVDQNPRPHSEYGTKTETRLSPGDTASPNPGSTISAPGNFQTFGAPSSQVSTPISLSHQVDSPKVFVPPPPPAPSGPLSSFKPPPPPINNMPSSNGPPPPPPPPAPTESASFDTSAPSSTAKMLASVQLKKVSSAPESAKATPADPRDNLLSSIRNREGIKLKKVEVIQRDAMGRPISNSEGEANDESGASKDPRKRSITGASKTSAEDNTVAAILMRRAAMEHSSDEEEEEEDDEDWD